MARLRNPEEGRQLGGGGQVSRRVSDLVDGRGGQRQHRSDVAHNSRLLEIISLVLISDNKRALVTEGGRDQDLYIRKTISLGAAPKAKKAVVAQGQAVRYRHDLI